MQKVLFLFLLLLCLCVSRGEGLRLFPFAAQVGSRTEVSASALSHPSFGRNLLPSAEALPGKHQSKSKSSVESDARSAAAARPAPAPVQPPVAAVGEQYGARFTPTKFVLTSASDRSPPSASVS